MQDPGLENITIDPLPNPPSSTQGITMSLLRLDKIHPHISGNKWFKLKFYIAEALATNKTTILTFGGAWSNHIIATAAACKMNNLQSIGLIRGERPALLSDTLTKAAAYGMQLIFISRHNYREKIIPAGLPAATGSIYLINEGGYGEQGASGAATIAEHYEKDQFTHVLCAVGTGTMMAGLVKSARPAQPVTGISVLKNNPALLPAIDALLTGNEKEKPHQVIHDYHFGGYAKYNPDLIHFMNGFYKQTHIATDFVYTGKLLFGAYDLVKKNYFPAHSRLLVIHSGGLQGNNSLPDDTLIF